MRSLLDATAQRMKSYSMNYEASDLHRFFCDPSGVKITSCHSTKGDEYDVVICTGLLKGKVPHWQDIRNRSMQHQNYVARRLLYVVASRAKKHLYMISENGYVSNSGYHYVKTEQL
ncbi:ATP-binding domain-containing protein, partial [Vibrio vulnificus]|nr:ATP-binding domain-containing protein [Vibrio vulnificus]